MKNRNTLSIILITVCSLLASCLSEQLIYTKTAKTLIVLDDWHYVETHSSFWNQLRGKY